MQEKIQLLRKALMDYLVCISAQDFSILVCTIMHRIKKIMFCT